MSLASGRLSETQDLVWKRIYWNDVVFSLLLPFSESIKHSWSVHQHRYQYRPYNPKSLRYNFANNNLQVFSHSKEMFWSFDECAGFHILNHFFPFLNIKIFNGISESRFFFETLGVNWSQVVVSTKHPKSCQSPTGIYIKDEYFFINLNMFIKM